MPSTQENRLLSLRTPLPYNDLLIRSLSAWEGISQLFRFELEIVKEESEAKTPPSIKDPKTLIGQPMSVTASQKEDDKKIERHFHGICSRLSQGNRDDDFTHYYAELVPHVWLLTQRSQSRIFQQKSVPDILKKVFTGFEVKYELTGKYEPRNYCVQYRESDFDFASRLMEDEGIFYFFEHSESGHQLVLADTPQSHKEISKATIPYDLDVSGVSDKHQSSIKAWGHKDRLRTGKYTLWDHNFELVGKKLEAQQTSRYEIGGNKQLEIYDWPGGYAGRYDGISPSGGEQASEINKIFEDNKRTVKVRQQELDAGYVTVFGATDCCAIVPGYKFTLAKHTHGEYNTSYILVSSQIELQQNPWYLPVPDDEKIVPVSVNFTALQLAKGPFRPARETPVPTVHGTQTAVVVGRSGEEIFTDKYGRVKVQFHWDREGKYNESSSCWIRVAQMWGGKKWGTMFIPRVGMEVLVDFLEGDPDQPIIIGSVYNAENMPPYVLPDEKTKSTIKTESSTGGGGFNEIRFEDKKGKEQIFIHAELDHETRIKRDQKGIILRDKHLIVERDQFEKVKKDKHLGVTGNQVEKVDGNVNLKVGSNKEQKIGAKYAVDSGSEIHLKAGSSVTIEASAQITLKAGGNFVNIGPSGVSIKGTMVLINSGGAAGSGGGASPDTPKDPQEADKAEPGQVTKVPSPPPPPQPPQFGKLADLVRQRALDPAAAGVAAALAGAEAAAASAQAAVAGLGQQGAAAAQQAQNAAAAAMAAAQNQVDEVKSKVDAIADKIKDKAAEAKALAEDLKDKAQSLVDQALAKAQEAKEKAEAMVDQAKQAVEDAKAAAQEKIEEAKQALEEAKAAAQEKIDEAKQAVEEAKQQVEQAAAEVKEQAEQGVAQAEQALADAKEQAQEAVKQAEQAVQEAQKQAEQAVQQAEQAAQQAQQQAEQAVQQAEQAVQQAQQQAEQAAQQAQQAVEGAADQAAQAAEQISEGAAKALQSAQDAIPFG